MQQDPLSFFQSLSFTYQIDECESPISLNDSYSEINDLQEKRATTEELAQSQDSLYSLKATMRQSNVIIEKMCAIHNKFMAELKEINARFDTRNHHKVILKNLEEFLFFTIKFTNGDGSSIASQVYEYYVSRLKNAGINDIESKANQLESGQYQYNTDEKLTLGQRRLFKIFYQNVQFVHSTSLHCIYDSQLDYITKFQNSITKFILFDKHLKDILSKVSKQLQFSDAKQKFDAVVTVSLNLQDEHNTENTNVDIYEDIILPEIQRDMINYLSNFIFQNKKHNFSQKTILILMQNFDFLLACLQSQDDFIIDNNNNKIENFLIKQRNFQIKSLVMEYNKILKRYLLEEYKIIYANSHQELLIYDKKKQISVYNDIQDRFQHQILQHDGVCSLIEYIATECNQAIQCFKNKYTSQISFLAEGCLINMYDFLQKYGDIVGLLINQKKITALEIKQIAKHINNIQNFFSSIDQDNIGKDIIRLLNTIFKINKPTLWKILSCDRKTNTSHNLEV